MLTGCTSITSSVIKSVKMCFTRLTAPPDTEIVLPSAVENPVMVGSVRPSISIATSLHRCCPTWTALADTLHMCPLAFTNPVRAQEGALTAGGSHTSLVEGLSHSFSAFRRAFADTVHFRPPAVENPVHMLPMATLWECPSLASMTGAFVFLGDSTVKGKT